ncbi:hypothetical protein EV421DRAFT_1906329 [Armillaria borealis]|uniref:Uncharacterized protein n=1 Tax=Armillaria borealis TaxID=47425 RepID=A0AA39JA49_9AGAR|nr:hypothetical protein EV421DRAFT_1906329 [Armillaria borealis]
MASIELEDFIKQSVTQLNRKLTVEKERDNCIILSSTGFGRGKAMHSPNIADLNVASATSLFGRLIGLVMGGGTWIGFMIAKAFAANGDKIYITGRRLDVLEQAAASVHRCLRVHRPNPDGRTDEGSVKTGAKHIEEVDRKIDTLVNNTGPSG